LARIGIDFGGTKIEAAVLDDLGHVLARHRQPNPGDYGASLEVVASLITDVERMAGISEASIGVGMPGSISPKTGRMRNANSVWLNDKPFKEDLERALARPVRLENDANCFTLSEAVDGAGAGVDVVFGVILGTGCGGGVVVRGRTVEGKNRIGGEWGHTPLPWPSAEERGAHRCWCGRIDCLETWVSGTAFWQDYERATGERLTGDVIIERMRTGEAEARAAFDRYVHRLGRALAVVGDILDPDIVVLGGGMSNTDELYAALAPIVARYIFSDVYETKILKAVHGDSSGVRGAAWLWPKP
jgi:fructokinase